ncbi:Uncharacterised protein [Phocoenobacter uteri]|uniref:Uncharacterized protein n=1 Tax=Phocoenobacter uteri TaxID=146806 RepID=A0A379C8W9_9PAST|nr:hypothetical protein [Phocoenobacter uteri]MDG6882590.1 hypothetical protein [Phocoenobacter uteri]SUB58753.1 Uncharacterised protein [Phocoenobacter uteri]
MEFLSFISNIITLNGHYDKALFVYGTPIFIAYEFFKFKTDIVANVKKDELFISIFNKNIKSYEPLVIEEMFYRYYKFYLSFEEILYCTKVTKPKLFISDLKACLSKGYVEFFKGEYCDSLRFKGKYKKVAQKNNFQFWCLTICFVLFYIVLSIIFLAPYEFLGLSEKEGRSFIILIIVIMVLIGVLSFMFVFPETKALFAYNRIMNKKIYKLRKSDKLENMTSEQIRDVINRCVQYKL